MFLSHAHLCSATDAVLAKELEYGNITPQRIQWLTEAELMARLRLEISGVTKTSPLDSRLVASGNKKANSTNQDIELGYPEPYDTVEGKYAHYFGSPEPGSGISKDLTKLRDRVCGHFVLFLPPMWPGISKAPYRLLDAIQCEGIDKSNRRLLSGAFVRSRPKGRAKPKWMLTTALKTSSTHSEGVKRSILGNHLQGLWAIIWSNSHERRLAAQRGSEESQRAQK